uniref:Uncharacterized protein n=1 Tax=Oryza brachyantha TaxID=4533 RepID=J3LW80_ORYBR
MELGGVCGCSNLVQATGYLQVDTFGGWNFFALVAGTQYFVVGWDLCSWMVDGSFLFMLCFLYEHIGYCILKHAFVCA